MTDDGGVDREALAERLGDVRQRIADAARGAGRDPDGITLVVVTKFQPIGLVRALADLGVADFGENRHPEARDKAAALPDAAWHFVGQLQTNKARAVARYADLIHSVDRPALVDALAGADRRPPVLLEIDLDGGAGRGGVEPAGAEPLAEAVLVAGLPLAGVMAVAPQHGDPPAAFARLIDTAERIRRLAPGATLVSAGMSGDFEAAIAAGATHLRIGVAITGPRPATPYSQP